MRATLKSVEGVQAVDVDFDRKLATVKYDSQKTDESKIADQLKAKTSGRYQAVVKKE